MILVGLNFSTKFTYISVMDEDSKQMHDISFGEAKGIRNAVYYKNKKLLTMKEMLREEEIVL